MSICIYTFTGVVGHDIAPFQLLQLQIKIASITTLPIRLINLIFGLNIVLGCIFQTKTDITRVLLYTFLLDILSKVLSV